MDGNRGETLTVRRGGRSREKCYFLFKIFFKSLFIYFERERQGGTEREGERIPSGPCALSAEPDAGLELVNREIAT